MRTLDRIRAAVDAFRNPRTHDGPHLSTTTDIDRERMNDVVETMFADAFRQFAAPDDATEAVGAIDPDLAREIADDIVDDLPHVPDDAMISRLELDAVNDVTVWYHLPDDADDAADWRMTPNEFFEAMNEVARRQGAAE